MSSASKRLGRRDVGEVVLRAFPATGSSHCTLTPYWAQRLGKTELKARQLSHRGGALRCTLNGQRVSIAGQAVVYLEGQIEV